MTGRPRSPEIDEKTRFCLRQGRVTTWRRWKAGKTKTGEQRYAWQCLPCHLNVVKAANERQRRETT